MGIPVQQIRRWDIPTALAIVVLVAAGTQLVWGGLLVGVTYDGPLQDGRTTTWLNQGWFVPSTSLADGKPDPTDPISSPYVYGPGFAIVAHAANVAVGNESPGGVSSSAGAVAVRHLTIAAIAVLAAIAVAIIVRALTHSWRFGIWGAAALFAIPAWTGHAFFNVKDVPAAAGYTLVTAGLVLALCAAGKTSRRRGLVIAALIGGGIFLAIGTRIALWVPVLASLMSYAALRAARRWSAGKGPNQTGDLAVAIGVALGLAGVYAIYPKAFGQPLKLLIHSVSDSAGYPTEIVTLTAGHLLTTHPPIWYLPAWFAAAIPILLWGLAVLGAVLGIRALVRADGEGRLRAALRRRELGLLLVLQQALLLPTAAVIGNATMYDGLRQHLYVIPAIAILAAVGAERLSAPMRSELATGARRSIVAAVLSAALIIPMVEQSFLFPYNYTYVNPVAELGGVNGRWETDYWFASAPEAIERVPRGVKLRCSMEIVSKWDPTEEPELGPCTGPYYGPFLDRRGDDAAEAGSASRDAWLILISRADNHPPPYCEEADNVTRDLLGVSVRMSYVLRCDPKRIR